MAGAPPDWFTTGESLTEPTSVDDATGARTGVDLGRLDTAPVEPAAELAPGTRLGRYVLEALVGEGAMGQVWRARDPQLDRAVAIKVVHPSVVASPDGGPRLLREARAMAKLSHPNVVAIHDAGDADGRLFIAMELVDGVALGDWLRAEPRRDWRTTLARFRDAGRGLGAAHAAGVLHRDFKADNVLIDRAGRVCVADFGLAAFGARTEAVAARHERPVTALTADGAVVGTPAFMSPEQLCGEAIDARADQFSFCAALYEGLYGEHAFLGRAPATIAALVEAIDRGAIRPPPPDDPVPRWVRAAVVRGLAADPRARWPDLPTLVAALAPPRRAPPLVIAAVALAVVVAVLATVVAVRARRSDGARPVAVTVTPVRRFDVSLASRIALAPDGARLAIGTAERLDVRGFGGERVWSQLDPDGAIERVAFASADRLLVAQEHPARLDEVALTTGARAERGRWPGWERWVGRIDGADVVARAAPGGWALGVDEGAGAVTPLVGLDGPAAVVAAAPDGRRLALIVERRYHGQIVVLDRRGVVARSPWIAAVTAVAWADDDTLIYATGTVETPALWRAELVGDRLGAPREVYRAERGWFGQLAVGGERVLFIDSGATFRSRVLDRAGPTPSPRELDPATVGATLGWLDDGRYLIWNRASGGVERHAADASAPAESTPARLDGEPVSATRAGDLLIATLRRDAGREVVAVSLLDGREAWRLAIGVARTVRCTDDRVAPCVVVRDGELTAEAPRVAWIDPADGRFGADVGPTGRVDDVALTGAGAHLLISDGSNLVRDLDLGTGAARPLALAMGARAVAYDPRGGILAAGTRRGSHYVVVRHDGTTETPVFQSRDEILFLPRPAPDGDAVLVMGRLFLPSLYELPRAAVR